MSNLNRRCHEVIRYGGCREEERFDSITAAARWCIEQPDVECTDNLTAVRSEISAACRNSDRVHLGHHWRFAKPVAPSKHARRDRLGRSVPVIRYGGGMDEKLFPDRRSAATWVLDNGYSKSRKSALTLIERVCNGGACRAYGFQWRWKDADAVKPARPASWNRKKVVLCHHSDGTVERFHSAVDAAQACVERGICKTDGIRYAAQMTRSACNPTAYGLRWEYENEEES